MAPSKKVVGSQTVFAAGFVSGAAVGVFYNIIGALAQRISAIEYVLSQLLNARG